MNTKAGQEDERLQAVRWCACGRPWVPAIGLYGTTEQTRCSACVLQDTVEQLRERLRHICRILVAEVGADGPCNAEEAAQRALVVIEQLRRAAAAVVEEVWPSLMPEDEPRMVESLRALERALSLRC